MNIVYYFLYFLLLEMMEQTLFNKLNEAQTILYQTIEWEEWASEIIKEDNEIEILKASNKMKLTNEWKLYNKLTKDYCEYMKNKQRK
jgi:hypothetical protein